MKLIVGLGNPGRIYQETRHNIGSLVVKTLAKQYNVSFKRGIFVSCLTAKIKIGDEDVVLAVPLVFMNLSGVALSSLIKKYKIEPAAASRLSPSQKFLRPSPMGFTKTDRDYNQQEGLENLMVVFDDLDLAPGNIRIKAAGSSGGHKGLESIIEALGTKGFPRLRIGIGRPKSKNADIAKYVLSPFPFKEKAIIQQTIEDCCLVLKTWVSLGIVKTMDIYNQMRWRFAESQSLVTP